MNLSLDGRGTLYEQIARAIKSSILDGQLAGNSRLPSTRTLAVVARAAERGVGVQRVESFYHVPPAVPGLLLGYAGLTPGQIRAAVGIFAGCLRRR